MDRYLHKTMASVASVASVEKIEIIEVKSSCQTKQGKIYEKNYLRA